MEDQKTTDGVVNTEANQNQTPPANPPETPENKDDLAKNYQKAMYIEREKAKEAAKKLEEYEAKLAEYAKKEAEEAEKDKIKKGKYEEVIAEQKTKLDELTKKAEAFDKLIQAQTLKLEEDLKTITGEIPEEVITKYQPITDKLSLEDKVAFYNNLKNDIKKEDFKQVPNAGGINHTGENTPKTFDEALKNLLIKK
ncbi:MAG TPA: hypothetical protein PLQ36_00605 [Candidatus Gracilibacteria bacterium]|nr:hypothetical protein [Candidatus Gracilibacteria bacterium]